MFFARRYRSVVPGLIVAVLFTIAGCSNSEPTSTKTETDKKTGETQAEKCRKKLAGAIRRLEPEELVTQANPERSINGLNAWLASCAADEVSELELDEPAMQILESNVRATASRFTVNDSSYVRDCLVLRDLTNSILQRSSDGDSEAAVHDATLVLDLFDWVVRNVSLIGADENRVPLGLFDILLTGRGLAEDRAWIFAEALRQQQIDAFIVRTAAKPSGKGGSIATAEWLVAVSLEGNSMLFDMRAGLPVVKDGAVDLLNPAPEKIAKLSEDDRWKECSAEIVAQIAAFAPRMLVLQQQLAVEDSAVLFEELTGGVSEIRPIRERIAEASGGLWKPEDVSIWSYPEATSVASQSLSEEQRNDHKQLMRPFDAPFERKTFTTQSTEELTTVPEALSPEERQALVQQRLMDNFSKVVASTEDMFGTPSKRLLKTRVRQILGQDDTGVIQQLQQIRITSMESVVRIQVPTEVQQTHGYPPILMIPLPQIIREVNLSSTGSALYWSALRQVELGEIGAAITTLTNYRRQYSGGQWTYPSMINQAMALLQQERKDDAVAVLKEADVDENPEQFRVQQMLTILVP